jgi:hypothetical protein
MDYLNSFAIVVFALLAGAWWFIRKYNPRYSQRRADGEASRPAASFHWPSGHGFDVEAVGESKWQPELKRIAGAHGTKSAETPCVAELRPEDSNRYDPKAVMVLVKGRQVGYLAREDAPQFRRRLDANGLSGRSTFCDALVVGGGIRPDGEKMYYGIRLDLEPFLED